MMMVMKITLLASCDFFFAEWLFASCDYMYIFICLVMVAIRISTFVHS